MGRRSKTELIVTEFAKFVDQCMEELGINQTLLIRNSGMTASGISQILKKGRGSSPYSINHLAVALDALPEKLFRLAGYLPPEPDGEVQQRMKELEFLFYKLPPERQAIAIDLTRALIDPTAHNDRFVFSGIHPFYS